MIQPAVRRAAQLAARQASSLTTRTAAIHAPKALSHRWSSSSAPLPPATADYLAHVAHRRSNYTLSASSPLSDPQLLSVLRTALDQTPSSFGTYSTRIVLLARAEHEKLWDIVAATLRAITPPEQWETSTKPRLDGFRAAFATVLFLEDPRDTAKLAERMPFLKDKLPAWQQHTSAMSQLVVWTALAAAGMGANLQHYNPLIDDQVKKEWGVPKDWELVAQMVVGQPTKESHAKPTDMRMPMEERLFAYGVEE